MARCTTISAARLVTVLALALLLPSQKMLGGVATAAADEDADMAGMDDEEDEMPSPYDDEEDDDEDEYVGEAETADVKTNVVFTTRQPTGFPAGSEVTALVGFNNVGDKPYVIKSISASFHSIDESDGGYEYVIQNFTALPVEHSCTPEGSPGELHGGDQASFIYKFTPEATLNPRDMTLALVINYSDEDDDSLFHSAAFNGTVTIVDAELGISILEWLKTLAYLAVAAYAAEYYFGVKAMLFPEDKTAKETGTRKVNNAEWVTAQNEGKKKTSSKKK